MVAPDFDVDRRMLVDRLVAGGYLKTEQVIDALLKVLRHRFIPDGVKHRSYVDTPLPIGWNQTISAPHMVALMTEALDVQRGQRILEVGAGSGYQAAVLAEIIGKGGRVYSVERVPELVDYARRNLESCDYGNVDVRLSDGTVGLSSEAPFDRIIVTAGAPRIPGALVDQLDDPGRLLIPVGDRLHQNLMCVNKKRGKVSTRSLGGCVFVPLIGVDGW